MESNIKRMIECLDSWMTQNHRKELGAVEAAEILDKAGLLKDSKARPGAPLRKILRNNEIPHARKINRNWNIPKSDS